MQEINVKTIQNLKRQAARDRKISGDSQSLALNKIAQNMGFQNWSILSKQIVSNADLDSHCIGSHQPNKDFEITHYFENENGELESEKFIHTFIVYDDNDNQKNRIEKFECFFPQNELKHFPRAFDDSNCRRISETGFQSLLKYIDFSTNTESIPNKGKMPIDFLNESFEEYFNLTFKNFEITKTNEEDQSIIEDHPVDTIHKFSPIVWRSTSSALDNLFMTIEVQRSDKDYLYFLKALANKYYMDMYSAEIEDFWLWSKNKKVYVFLPKIEKISSLIFSCHYKFRKVNSQ